MLQIVESVSVAPIRLLTVKGLKYEPGRIVELAEFDNNPCCIVSDGVKPFGIITDTPDKWGLVPVWFDSMVLRTSIFESSVNYSPGNSVYVSERGLLTTEKCYDNSHLMGHVVTGIAKGKDYIEINWI